MYIKQQLYSDWGPQLMTPIIGIMASSRLVSTTSYESIATVTVGSGGQSSIDFTSIPGTYTHLQIRSLYRISSAAEIKVEINGVTTTGSYWRHYLQGSGSGVGAAGNNNNSMAGYYETATNIFGTHIIDILDYKNTNKTKVVRTLWGFDANGSGYVGMTSGFDPSSTSAITSISLVPTGGNFTQYSSFALYGIKG
jgi:hypothetical protein